MNVGKVHTKKAILILEEGFIVLNSRVARVIIAYGVFECKQSLASDNGRLLIFTELRIDT